MKLHRLQLRRLQLFASAREAMSAAAIATVMLALSASVTSAAAAPDTTITSGPSGTITTANATFEFTSSRSNSTFKCSMDGSAWTACTSPQGYTNLSNGSHTFRVKAKNGTQVDPTPASRTFKVEVGAPTVTIKSGPGSTTRSSTVTFKFVADQSNVTFQCKLDSSSWVACGSGSSGSYTTNSGAVNHQHVFKVRATNSHGATGLPATYDYTRLS